MKDINEIINQSKKENEGIPDSYNLLESYCYLSLRQLVVMYKQEQLSKENAITYKEIIVNDYNKKKEEYEKFENYQKKMKNIDYMVEDLKWRLAKVTPLELQESDRNLINTALKVIEVLIEKDINF